VEALAVNDVAKRIAAESGNAFHCRVANAFRDRGWATMLSPYYIDGSTDKVREIDLLAEKAFPVPGEFSRVPKSVRVRLHIECKYITQHVVYWFDSRDDRRALEWIFTNTPFRRNNTFVKDHHHLRGVTSVAKLFATEGKRSEDNDPIFRALNQCLNGFIQNRGGDWLLPANEHEEVHLLEYPVIVCSDFATFFRTDIRAAQDPEPIADNFLLELNYAFVDRAGVSRRDYFLVDLIAFPSLDGFLAAIESEVQAAKMLVGD
jgi:hypothetical protein